MLNLELETYEPSYPGCVETDFSEAAIVAEALRVYEAQRRDNFYRTDKIGQASTCRVIEVAEQVRERLQQQMKEARDG